MEPPNSRTEPGKAETEEEEREGWMRGRSSEGKGREENVQEESAQQVVVHYETSPLLLEHWMPAKDDEENKQLQ